MTLINETLSAEANMVKRLFSALRRIKLNLIGASTYCGTLLGKGNIQKAREVFTTNAVSVIIFALILTAAYSELRR